MGNEAEILGSAWSLSRSTVVALMRKGVRLPGDGTERSLAVHPADLVLLMALAEGRDVTAGALVEEVAARTGADAASLATFLDELALRHLLVPGSVPVEREDAPAATIGSIPSGGSSDERFVAATPTLLRPGPGGFDLMDHDGHLTARLGVTELAVAKAFADPTTMAGALASLAPWAAEQGLTDPDVELIVATLRQIGLVIEFDAENSAQARHDRETKAMVSRLQGFVGALRTTLDAHDAAEEALVARTGRHRVRVLPMQIQPGLPPVALGMLFAYAQAYEGGKLLDTFDFVPNWWVQDHDLATYAERPAVYLFSNYVWSQHENLAMSEKAKAQNGGNLIVHGGPDTPRNPDDVAAFFGSFPHVDVAVHGEGEVTTAEMLEALAGGLRPDGSFDISVLADVAGLTYRDGDRIVRTADRDRQADLDELPSPYLSGVFEAFENGNGSSAIIETNRGCPYGCTFCDWGSATNSRIRKFDIERVFAELDWIGRNQIPRVFIADANFGIMERDVAIAEKLVETKRKYGFPKVFSTNYAKNTVKHLQHIVQLMVEEGVLTEGLLSLQTMDEQTLLTIKRSNIKTEKYDLLASEFRAAGLPLFVDIMLGLPGSTGASFRNDLQQCIDREVSAKIFPTEVLVNSPMNEPEYRNLHQIQTANAGERIGDYRIDETSKSRRRLIVSTSSFTRSDYDEMLDLRRLFRFVENYGVLRQVSRYVRQETGLREVDFMDRLRSASKDRERWPEIALTLSVVPDVMVPPVSWRLFIDEVGRFLVAELGVADDDALATVLAVQHLVLPAPARSFPVSANLAHDFASWHADVILTKETDPLGWTEVVAPLRSYGPASFTVDDPKGVCAAGIGFRSEEDYYSDWELGSPVSRAMPARHRLNA